MRKATFAGGLRKAKFAEAYGGGDCSEAIAEARLHWSVGAAAPNFPMRLITSVRPGELALVQLDVSTVD